MIPVVGDAFGKGGKVAKGVIENADIVVKNLDEAVEVANKEQNAKNTIDNGINYSKSFFENSTFTDKVKQQMKWPDNHGFPNSVDAFEKEGIRFMQQGSGKDMSLYEHLNIPGSYKGKNGIFEFIKNEKGEINHRYFRIIKEE